MKKEYNNICELEIKFKLFELIRKKKFLLNNFEGIPNEKI